MSEGRAKTTYCIVSITCFFSPNSKIVRIKVSCVYLLHCGPPVVFQSVFQIWWAAKENRESRKSTSQKSQKLTCRSWAKSSMYISFYSKERCINITWWWSWLQTVHWSKKTKLNSSKLMDHSALRPCYIPPWPCHSTMTVPCTLKKKKIYFGIFWLMYTVGKKWRKVFFFMKLYRFILHFFHVILKYS